jgi:hypothetical protein
MANDQGIHLDHSEAELCITLFKIQKSCVVQVPADNFAELLSKQPILGVIRMEKSNISLNWFNYPMLISNLA